MKLGIVVASENALPSAFAVFRGIEKSAEITIDLDMTAWNWL